MSTLEQDFTLFSQCNINFYSTLDNIFFFHGVLLFSGRKTRGSQGVGASCLNGSKGWFRTCFAHRMHWNTRTARLLPYRESYKLLFWFVLFCYGMGGRRFHLAWMKWLKRKNSLENKEETDFFSLPLQYVPLQVNVWEIIHLNCGERVLVSRL